MSQCFCDFVSAVRAGNKIKTQCFIADSHLKLCMNCLNLSVRLDSGTMMLIGTLTVSTLSFFTFISGPNGRKRTRRLNSLLDSPLKVSSYSVPLSFSVRVIPDGWDAETWAVYEQQQYTLYKPVLKKCAYSILHYLGTINRCRKFLLISLSTS